jgi:hypothetical protein
LLVELQSGHQDLGEPHDIGPQAPLGKTSVLVILNPKLVKININKYIKE